MIDIRYDSLEAKIRQRYKDFLIKPRRPSGPPKESSKARTPGKLFWARNSYWTQFILDPADLISQGRPDLFSVRAQEFRDRCAFERAKARRFKGACFEIDIRCESLEAKIRRHAKQGASIQK